MSNAKRQPKSNDDRLGMRLSAELKKKVDYAAQLKGMPTAGFVKVVLSEAADKAIQEHQLIDLSLADREALVDALLTPKEPSERVLQAAKRYKERLNI